MRRKTVPTVGVYVVFTKISDILPRNLAKKFVLRKHKSRAGEGKSRHSAATRFTLHGSHCGFIRTLSIRTAEITLCLSRTTMSATAAGTPMATPAKSPKRRVGFKKGTSSISSLILKAMAASSDRGGMSLAALKKQLKAGGFDVDKKNGRILVAIKRLVAKKSLVRTKGSFRLNKKPPTPRKKKVGKKKTSVKKVKKTKKTATGTPSATPKKSPKKKKAKSAKKAKKPAPAKRPKKAVKKIKRKAARTTRTRRATPKK